MSVSHSPAIGDKPHQPKSFRFPQREFGKTVVAKRSFQPQWFDRWSWLHYDEDKDLAFCFTCVVEQYTTPITDSSQQCISTYKITIIWTIIHELNLVPRP